MDWEFIETHAEEAFSRIEYFGFKKPMPDGTSVDFVVTLHHYRLRPDPAMSFFAQADKQVNQKTAPYTPSGWCSTAQEALWECLKSIRKFPYQPE